MRRPPRLSSRRSAVRHVRVVQRGAAAAAASARPAYSTAQRSRVQRADCGTLPGTVQPEKALSELHSVCSWLVAFHGTQQVNVGWGFSLSSLSSRLGQVAAMGQGQDFPFKMGAASSEMCNALVAAAGDPECSDQQRRRRVLHCLDLGVPVDYEDEDGACSHTSLVWRTPRHLVQHSRHSLPLSSALSALSPARSLESFSPAGGRPNERGWATLQR